MSSLEQDPSFATATSSGIHLSRDADVLINSFLPASESLPPYPSQGLPLPLCVPQISADFGSPFARGYNASLADTVQLSQEQLLSFIDGLNLAIVASPPLRVVDLAGKIIGFVPYHWAMLAGAVMQASAQTAMHVLSKTLTDRYLRAANLNLFKPRGLSVRLCTTPAMQQLLTGSSFSKGKKKMDKIGRKVGSVLLRLPITGTIVRAVAEKPPTIAPSATNAANTVITRRLALVDGIALPLDLNVPPAAKPSGVMDTVNSWGVKLTQFTEGRQEKKAEEKRRALAIRNGQDPGPRSGSPPGLSSLDMSIILERVRTGRMQLQSSLGVGRPERRFNALDSLGSGSVITAIKSIKDSPLERDVKNADLREHWKSKDVLWIVIVEAEIDDTIEGIELADSLDNEERIDDRTWERELEREEAESKVK